MSSVFSRIKSIIVLNGSLPTVDRFHTSILNEAVTLIAADGAAWSLSKLGLNPQIIIGDLDSLKAGGDAAKQFPTTEIIEEPNQESNDFEKALKLVQKRGLAPVLVVGMQGGDLEHSFNNWSVAMKLCSELELWILENDRVGIGLSNSIRAICGEDRIVSLIPQPQCKLTTQGLRWELQNERLALGEREGARNIAVDAEFGLQVHSGSVLVFIHQDTKIIELNIAGSNTAD